MPNGVHLDSDTETGSEALPELAADTAAPRGARTPARARTVSAALNRDGLLRSASLMVSKRALLHWLSSFLVAIVAITNGVRPSQGAESVPAAPPEWLQVREPNLDGNIAHPLRYRPEGTDFVIENGREFFNRPLYCLNSAFRVDGGDKPEFSLYVPGRGGNLRFGIRTTAGAKWLNDADQIVMRYRPGSLLYEIHDSWLGNGELALAVLPLSDSRGLIARVMLSGAKDPVELLWGFGGANGQRGSRGGDIGCEREPISQYFQLRPEECRGNTFVLGTNTFLVRSAAANLTGIVPSGSVLAVADANKWNSPSDLFASAGHPASLPVLAGCVAMPPGQQLFLRLLDAGTTEPARSPDLADSQLAFTKAEEHRGSIAGRVAVNTPDPFINAAVAALNVAGDAIWDAQQGVYMHGAVAWRTRLLGWRGPYTADALGWHDRAAQYLTYWAGRQNTSAIPAEMPPADPAANLARNEAALHSNGDLSNSHYDMNLVYIDTLFRHLLWTGDVDMARRLWPVLERHLAWERRLFRRPFGPDKLPLYEAYAAIWASDNLGYDGAGTAHATAYNYYHNKMAARVARWIGGDPAPYEREAELINRAMREYLWLDDRGWIAESRDYLGRQLAHPYGGLWTFYHTVDEEAATPLEAWQMSRYVDSEIAHIPVRGPGAPAGNFYVLPTSSWMPYMWSLNNVVMAENVHTSLALWQAGQIDSAYSLFKGSVLAGMYMGLCPGNAGMSTEFDMARREAQRDFGDAIGITSRAVVEGLFGVQPDALAGELIIRPGFPPAWNHASIRHPDFAFGFRREGNMETYNVEPHFSKPMSVRLQVAALRCEVAGVTINGTPVAWHALEDCVGTPRIEIDTMAAAREVVTISWRGEPPAVPEAPPLAAVGREFRANLGSATVKDISDPQNVLRNVTREDHSIRGEITGVVGARTVFAKIQQHDLVWWAAVPVEVRPAFEIEPAAVQDDHSIRFRIRNNTSDAVDREIAIEINGHAAYVTARVPALGESSEMSLPANGLLPGSIPVRVDFGKEAAASGTVVNWKLRAPENSARWECIDLASQFNDRVTQIFRNDYTSPRSPFCSLALPKQGIGGWADNRASFNVDDSGLRAAAARAGGRFLLPEGVPFETPGAPTNRNILFTSQWNNYPREASVPLAGRASHVYVLMAGSSNPMQSRFDNGEVVITYTDGSTNRLALNNPVNWWPIDQDYFIDDFAFRRPEPIPPRVDLKTGEVRLLDVQTFKGRGGTVSGGAATVLDLPLDPARDLNSLTVRTLSNDVVIGLMAVTLAR